MGNLAPAVQSDIKESGLLGEYNPIVYGVTPSNIYRPGKQEWVVASTYLRMFLSGGSMVGVYEECARALKAGGFRAKTALTCRRWLDRSHVKQWVEEELKLQAIKHHWTRERWLLKMTEHLDGVRRLAQGDLYGMKLLASVMGWEAPEAAVVAQINFTERVGI